MKSYRIGFHKFLGLDTTTWVMGDLNCFFLLIIVLLYIKFIKGLLLKLISINKYISMIRINKYYINVNKYF